MFPEPLSAFLNPRISTPNQLLRPDSDDYWVTLQSRINYGTGYLLILRSFLKLQRVHFFHLYHKTYINREHSVT